MQKEQDKVWEEFRPEIEKLTRQKQKELGELRLKLEEAEKKFDAVDRDIWKRRDRMLIEVQNKYALKYPLYFQPEALSQ